MFDQAEKQAGKGAATLPKVAVLWASLHRMPR